MLCAGRHFNDGFSLEGRDFHFSTENGRDKVDRHITSDIEAFALKDLMRLNGNGHVEIARWPTVGAMLSFIGEAKSHAGLYAGWNMDGDGALFVNPLTSLAGRAGFRDKVAGAFTLTTGSADTEEPLLKPQLPSTFAAGAWFDGRCRLCAGPFAVDANFPTRDFEFGLFSVDGFLKRDFEVVLEIVATFSASCPAPSRLAEKILEDVVKHIPESAASEIESLKTWSTLLCAGVAEHVVAFSFFLITQYFIGFIDFFEFFFGGLFLMVACVEVRMVLASQFPVRLLQVVIGDVAIDTESFVVIAL